MVVACVGRRARVALARVRPGEQLDEVAGRDLQIDDPGRWRALAVEPKRLAQAQLRAVEIE